MTTNADSPLAWHRGRIRPLAEILISAADRTFEHGLGLFETMRGQAGRVPLYERHMRRLNRSAAELRLRLDPMLLPSEGALADLLEQADLASGPARVRLVLTGGSAAVPGEAFASVFPVIPLSGSAITLAESFWPVDERDPLVQHKSLNYWLRRRAADDALAMGADDMLSMDSQGHVWESAKAALFAVVDGRWTAPSADGPFLRSVAAGCVEELLTETLRLELDRRTITPEVLRNASELILANAVRGPMAVAQWGGVRYDASGLGISALSHAWRETFY
jgi:branched-subunit amino acid aminotransferase/4-amino-4-deoxychorismate lyase